MANTYMEKEELKSRMDRIINWVQVCDTKASIMLSVVSLIAGFLFTSDYMLNGLQEIVKYTFVVKEKGNCSVSAVLALVCCVLTIVFVILAIYNYILVLRAKVNEDQTNDEKVKENSLIHFNHISKIADYDTFKSAMKNPSFNEEDDYLSQIYVNAKRCSEKFHDYNDGIKWTYCGMATAIMCVISIVIYVASNNIIR